MNLPRRHLLGIAALTLGCGRSRGRGASATDAAPASRIVSLSPVITDALIALGARGRLVGVSNLCDAPAAAGLPRVGTMVAPSLDAIASLRPDAIVAVEGPLRDDALSQLRARGVRSYAPRVETVADVKRALPLLASLGGRPAAAAELNASIERGLARIARALEARPRVRVVAVCAQEPLVVAAPSSWVGELLSLAGCENPVRHSAQYPIVSVEQVASLVPEAVVDLTAPASPLSRVWSSQTAIPAVATGRVLRVEDPIVRRQGPRVVEAVSALVRALHPGVAV